MSKQALKAHAPLSPSVITAARAEAIEGDRVTVTVASEVYAARCVVAGGLRPRVGDEVLVAIGVDGAWVLSLIGTLRATTPLVTPDGVEAVLEAGALTVRDVDGEVLFEHAAGKTVIHAPRGNLELRADAGAIHIAARDGVEIEGGSHASLRAERLKVEGEHRLDMATERLRVQAYEAVVTARSSTLLGTTARTVVDRVETIAGVLDVRASRILERAKSTYREVEDVAQLRAGRVRSIAEKTWSVLSRRTRITAEEDVAIDGDRIHLG